VDNLDKRAVGVLGTLKDGNGETKKREAVRRIMERELS
jgi:hypothetical protein